MIITLKKLIDAKFFWRHYYTWYAQICSHL